jgi:AcrR family transcriptional regulator
MRAARREFAEKGYEAASLEGIAQRARVTKGALYHHFEAGKLALFGAVFEQLEAELVQKVAASAATTPDDPWQQIEAALNAFVQHSTEPEYLQVVLHDGPRLVAMRKQREIDLGQGVHVIEAMMQALVEAGQIPEQPVSVLARVLLGALSEGAQAIAQAADRERAMAEVHTVMWRLLRGLRHSQDDAKTGSSDS